MTTDPQTPVEELEGRQLDRAIAEEVFGDPPPDEPPTKEEKSGPYIARRGDHWIAAHHVYKGPYWSYSGPDYATEIDAAWKVMEWLAENEYKANLTVWREEDVGRWFACRVTEVYPGFDEWEEQSDNPAEAICRAALRAVRQ